MTAPRYPARDVCPSPTCSSSRWSRRSPRPTAARRLADAGARVIKIERAEGDFARGYDTAANGLSSYFVWLNRGKQSLVADIKQPGRRRTAAPAAGARRRVHPEPRPRRGRARRASAPTICARAIRA